RIADGRDDLADLLDVAQHAHPLLSQQLLRDGAGGNTTDGLARRRPAAAAVVAETVAGVEGEIGVAGAILGLDVGVILAALVGVAEQDADRRAVGAALEDAGPDLRHVLLLALGHDLRLPRPAAAQVRQQVLDRERQSGGAAVDDEQIAGPVADAGGRDTEQLAEGIAWHGLRTAAGGAGRKLDSGPRPRARRLARGFITIALRA